MFAGGVLRKAGPGRVALCLPMERAFLDWSRPLGWLSCWTCSSSCSPAQVPELISEHSRIGVVCIPRCIFSVKPSERSLIEILSFL